MSCRLVACLLLFGCSLLSAGQRDPRTASVAERGLSPADFPQLKKLADDVYTFSDLHSGGLGYLTNDLIVVTTAGVLVADGQGTPAVTQKLVEQIAKLTPQPISYVIVCSEHGDHTGGNSAFPKTATFIASPFSKANLEQQARTSPTTVVPTETVADRRAIMLGSTEIDVLYNGRAHTGGDLEVYLPKARIAFLSEVFSNHVFPSMRTAYPTEWVATLKKVSQIDADLFVPGHGFVEDAPTLKAELRAFSDAVTYVVAESTRLHASGMTVVDGLKAANWGPYETWTSKSRNAQIALQRVYDELDGKLKTPVASGSWAPRTFHP
jgi:glyoxylase-like metal-dependent hydrolase (beta-lactamase superfamily II)